LFARTREKKMMQLKNVSKSYGAVQVLTDALELFLKGESTVDGVDRA